jgi:hypothetical protein
MRRLLAILTLAAAFALPAAAAPGDHLEGVLPLAQDDRAAVAQIQATPERHAMIYFGDHAN